jgi:hypothetical protein
MGSRQQQQQQQQQRVTAKQHLMAMTQQALAARQAVAGLGGRGDEGVDGGRGNGVMVPVGGIGGRGRR